MGETKRLRTSTQGESKSRRRIRQLLAKGKTIREIALLLGVSTQAVYRHVRDMREAEAGDRRAS